MEGDSITGMSRYHFWQVLWFLNWLGIALTFYLLPFHAYNFLTWILSDISIWNLQPILITFPHSHNFLTNCKRWFTAYLYLTAVFIERVGKFAKKTRNYQTWMSRKNCKSQDKLRACLAFRDGVTPQTEECFWLSRVTCIRKLPSSGRAKNLFDWLTSFTDQEFWRKNSFISESCNAILKSFIKSKPMRNIQRFKQKQIQIKYK